MMTMRGEPSDKWDSYHLYYHEDLSRAVPGFVYPTILALWRAGWVEKFFFVRYGLGGPHIRFRVQPVPGHSEVVDRTIRQAAESFLSRSPSTASINEETLRLTTESILSKDPHESDGTIYPDNTFTAVPFHPEVARYGGPDLLSHSLEFFTLSSIAALDFLARFQHEPRSRQLILSFRLVLRQALGFAADPNELLALLAYGVLSWGEALPAILEKGDRVFATRTEALCQLFTQEISKLSLEAPTDNTAACLGAGAQLLSLTVGRDDRRRGIGISQLHMTATRLGLSNPEEAYVSRLLSLTAKSVFDRPDTRSHVAELLAKPWRLTEPRPELGSLLPQAFALLGAA